MKNAKGNLVIIDFGLSHVVSLNKEQESYKTKKRGFIGTPRYASIAAHQGIYQTPKDDIESMFYVMGFMKLKKAPWFQLKSPVSERLKKIEKIKVLHSMQWFQECGHQFA